MKHLIIKQGIRALFFLTPRAQADKQTQKGLRDYLALADQIHPDMGSRSVTVPPMPGVDEDMRHWSFYQILSHNTLVNRSITATVEQLVNGESLHGAAIIDPKRDVMPPKTVGEEQRGAFKKSVIKHLNTASHLDNLRGTHRSPHPLFGAFDAHRWNCMFAFHLKVHYPQAAYVARKLLGRKGRP
jgi:hypothetical protein